MNNDKIIVLMSTYNGEQFLIDQIDSIIKQNDVNLSLVVRDDGSTDNTLEILDSWGKKDSLKWYQGENLKPARSFLHLLNDAGDADYYAFSDQDDYWMPDKLSSAIKSLKPYKDVPALYFCQTQLADCTLNCLPSVVIKPKLTLGEALVYQFIGGCTMVMNSKLRDIIIQYEPSYLTMHDIWIYGVALAVGAKVIFDPIPHILYRQHGGNVVGQSVNRGGRWKNRWKSHIVNHQHFRYQTALEIVKGYSDFVSNDNMRILQKFVDGHNSFFKRISLFFDKNYKCANKRVYRDWRLCLLLNIY